MQPQSEQKSMGTRESKHSKPSKTQPGKQNTTNTLQPQSENKKMGTLAGTLRRRKPQATKAITRFETKRQQANATSQTRFL